MTIDPTANAQPSPLWTDSQGRTWDLQPLRIAFARNLKGGPLDILDPAKLDALLSDERLQLDLLFRLLREQALAHAIKTADEFDEAMTAAETDYPQALAALMGRLAVFFRRLARAHAAAALEKAAAVIVARLQQPQPTAPTDGPKSTNLPAASG